MGFLLYSVLEVLYLRELFLADFLPFVLELLNKSLLIPKSFCICYFLNLFGHFLMELVQSRFMFIHYKLDDFIKIRINYGFALTENGSPLFEVSFKVIKLFRILLEFY